MAALNNDPDNGSSSSKKIRSKKAASRVDLTAMVDLAFLLITFFMLTTSLSEAKAMELVMPESGKPFKVDENLTLTVLIGANNSGKCFMGKQLDNAKNLTVGSRELRQELASRKKEAQAYSAANGKPDQGLIVIIKPGKASSYGNLVDVLDEMAISDIKSYSISDLNDAELQAIEK